jgi:hypothetical protein
MDENNRNSSVDTERLTGAFFVLVLCGVFIALGIYLVEHMP